MAETKPRRARGEGTIRTYETKAGTRYFIKAWVDDADGVPRQRMKRGFRTQREAGKALRELIAAGEQVGGYVPPAKISTGAYLDLWLDGLSLAPSTVSSYRKNVRVHIKPALGAVPLAQLSSTRITAFYKHLEKAGRADGTGGLSKRTVRYIHTILHKALATAVKDRTLGLKGNPADDAEPPRAKDAKAPEMSWWTPEDAAAFLAWAAASVRDKQHVTAWRVILATGARRGELLALRWKDVDVDAGKITFRKSVTTIKEHGKAQHVAEGSTKNGKTRVVDIDEDAVKALREHRAYRSGLAFTLGTRDAIVFGDEEGAWRVPESFSRTFREQVARFRTHQLHEAQTAAQKAGKPVHVEQVPAVHLHDLRHTHAVWLLKAGVHPKVVQERLGHETIGITMDTYSHVMPSLGREAAALAGAMLSQAMTGS